MNITLELTPEMARKITEMATSNAATEDQMRRAIAEIAAQIPPAHPGVTKQPRQSGFLLGAFTMHADFDEPLPDAFWLGEQ